MNVIREAGGAAGPDAPVLVMLPGAGDRAQDLVDHGFAQALRARRLCAEAVLVDAHTDYYLDSSIAARLEAVVAAARSGGARRVWMMGISLGCLGALSHAREHGGVDGMMLLAPFLGTRGLIAEIARAGGLRTWQPGPLAPADPERRLAAWLKDYHPGGAGYPPIFLGYGSEDRFATASALLAAQLPARHVHVVPGGHEWATWLTLWEQMLDAGVLASRPTAGVEQ